MKNNNQNINANQKKQDFTDSSIQEEVKLEPNNTVANPVASLLGETTKILSRE